MLVQPTRLSHWSMPGQTRDLPVFSKCVQPLLQRDFIGLGCHNRLILKCIRLKNSRYYDIPIV